MKQSIDIAAEEVDKEAEAEHAVNNRRHAGQVVHRDPDRLGQPALPRVFAQIYRSDDAEGSDDDRHDQHHYHGAKNRGENTAFGIRLARVVGEELGELGKVETDLFKQAHGIGSIDPDDFGDRNLKHTAVGGRHRDAVAVDLRIQRFQFLLQPGVFRLQPGALRSDRILLDRYGLGRQIGLLELQTALAQPQLLQAVIDVADFAFLDLMNIPEQRLRPLQALFQCFIHHCFVDVGVSHHRTLLLYLAQEAVEIAPFAPLQYQGRHGIAFFG